MARRLFSSVALFSFAGCLGFVSMTVAPLPKPGADVAINRPVLAKIKSIAVLPFEDSKKLPAEYLPSPPYLSGSLKFRYPYANDGVLIAEKITTYLAKSFQFRMVDRKYVQQVLDEQKFQQSGAVDERKAVQLGKLVGADAILVGRVNTCMFVTTYKHNGGDTITQEIAHINVDFKIIDVETGDLAVIANHSLNAQHLLKKPVKMESRKILNTPNYYTKYFASADQMIDIYVEETLRPVVEAKEELNGK